MKWFKNKFWIYFAITILVCILAYLLFRRVKEGFQIPFRSMTTSNVPYPFNEVFLLSPTNMVDKYNGTDGKGIYSNDISTGVSAAVEDEYTKKGYSFKDARAYCQSLALNYPDLSNSMIKPDLATPAQIKRAFDLSGNWCVRAWASDGNAYYLPNGTNMCGIQPGQATHTLKKLTLRENQYAFAICYAPKPPAPAIAIQPFNVLQYNFVSSSALNEVMNGTGSDIFPILFSADQANYALDKPFVYNTATNMYVLYNGKYGTNGQTIERVDPTQPIQQIQYNAQTKRYEILTTGSAITLGDSTSVTSPTIENLKYNPVAARQYLIANFDTVNQKIISVSDTSYSDKPTDWVGVNPQGNSVGLDTACNAIIKLDTEYSSKLQRLRNLFRDVSGTVISLTWAKQENANIQATLYDACASTTPISSPACAKLATIDYDLFYTNPTQSTLSDLETLNYYRFYREQEICTTIANLKTVASILPSCSYTSNITDCPGMNINKETGQISQFDPNDSSVDSNGNKYYQDKKSYINFDINNVEVFKEALMQLSPLFQRSDYNDLLTNVFTQLSYVLRIPDLTDFSTASMKFNSISGAIKDIRSLLDLPLTYP